MIDGLRADETSAMAAVDDGFLVVVDGTLRGLSIATAVDLIGDGVEENFPLPAPIIPSCAPSGSCCGCGGGAAPSLGRLLTKPRKSVCKRLLLGAP
jgi:hypothetical protein